MNDVVYTSTIEAYTSRPHDSPNLIMMGVKEFVQFLDNCAQKCVPYDGD